MASNEQIEEAADKIESEAEQIGFSIFRNEAHLLARAAYAVFERQRGWRPTHRHKKRGTEYEIITDDALAQTDISIADNEQVVVYRGHDGRIWVRTREEFDDGRFELIAPPAP